MVVGDETFLSFLDCPLLRQALGMIVTEVMLAIFFFCYALSLF